MTTQQLESRLQSVLTDTGINLTALTDATNFSHDLGLDSLATADLLMQIERQFSIRISDEDWWKLKTWGQLKAYIVDELSDQSNYSPGYNSLRQFDVYGPSL